MMDKPEAGGRHTPLRQAAGHFLAFFAELEQAFVERRDLLRQIALALLAREHVLMAGPPGTAKSQLAQAVLGRIVSAETGKASVFSRQFTESTVQTDLVGPIDFKTLMESGRTEHFTDEGILGAVHAFLDEVFDGRDMLLRSTLNLLHERELKQGTKVTAGKIEGALMTTNRYPAEILDNSSNRTWTWASARASAAGATPTPWAASSRAMRPKLGKMRVPPASKRMVVIGTGCVSTIA